MNKKQQIVLFSVIAGIVFLLIASFIVYPLYRGIKMNAVGLVSVKVRLDLLQDRTGGFEQVKNQYKGLKQDLQKIDDFFTDPTVPVEIIRFWETTARNAGVSITISPSFASAREADPWNSMGFQIVLTGSFSDGLRFLEKVETGPYLVEIGNISARRFSKREVRPGQTDQITAGDVRITILTKVFTK